MSNKQLNSGLLLAAITALLKRLLQDGITAVGITDTIGDVAVSALPADRIITGSDERPQLNLFLYQVTPNTSMRTTRSVRLQQSIGKHFALDMHYLVTAYGGQELHIESLLGIAIQLLAAANPIIQKEIRRLLQLVATDDGSMFGALHTSEVSTMMMQIDQLVITPQFLSSEDVSRLWSGLQARYRPSVGYKVSIIVMEEIAS